MIAGIDPDQGNEQVAWRFNEVDRAAGEWHLDQRMNVTLTPRHQRYVAAKVKSGAYGSVEEVIG